VHHTVERVEVGYDTAVVLSRTDDELSETLKRVWRIGGEVEGERRRDLVEEASYRGWKGTRWENGLWDLFMLWWLVGELLRRLERAAGGRRRG